MRRAKIVATLGPALDDRERLRAALEAGIDVVRLNFSHGDQETHGRRLEQVRALADSLGRTVGSLADLQGPKIRLGVLPDEGIMLPQGAEVFLVPGRERLESYHHGDGPALPVVYERLTSDVTPGALVLIDDGSIRLVVSRHEDGGVWGTVVAGGRATSRKGVNLPGADVSAPSLTDKDVDDLAYAVRLGVDWIALSFVRGAADLTDARKRVHALAGQCPVVAKLERPEAVERLSDVVAAADAVMVARGDLGVEIGPERVPAIQKEIIAQANARAKPVITATEMLESMIASPRATRAEASDVANAVFDGSDALMLSGETAVGRYPVEAVRTMARIIEVAESSRHLVHPHPPHIGEGEIDKIVARAACLVANDVRAAALAVFTITGHSLQLVSKFRPSVPLVGLTPHQSTRGRTALMWGVEVAVEPLQDRPGALLTAAERVLVDGSWARRGDPVVVVSGLPGGTGTNRVVVHRIGDPIR